MPGPAHRPFVRRPGGPVLSRGASAGGGGGGAGISDPPDLTWTSWYWAEDLAAVGNGNTVATWTDNISGATRQLAQATEAAKPIFRSADASFSNHACVEFDGTDDVLVSASSFGIWNGGDQTFVAVMQHTQVATGTNGNTHCQIGDNSSGTLYTGTAGQTHWYSAGTRWSIVSSRDTTKPRLFVMRKTGATAKSFLHVNDVTGTDPNTSNIGIATVYIGRAPGWPGYGKGKWAFIGIIDRRINDTELASLRTWSQAAYGTD